ncbi:hypothetical protein [Corynebacterium terpenotabidum]|uniref:Secreted protein n=1 Tax=Corynebacterium terpenotabidum Y-11 TaxID=1200352 RepID=S4XE68_9CORY|nr:hypothetical protein [Corynebacterium terpenotabidum]AGP31437.1 hypothetical protein A606_08980 [Corynebacterium terpenotabidum Y-11]
MSKNTTFVRPAVLGAVAALGLGMLPVVTAPPALAATVSAQQTYNCAITVDENPSEPSYMDLTININLDLPDQVSPGDSFSVDGSFSVQLPSELGSLFGAYFPSAQVTTDTLTIPVNVAGQDQLLATSRIDSGRVDTRIQPVVFSGAFTTDPVSVPADATGDVSFSMPRNGSVPAISEEGMSAFTAVMVAEGGVVPGYDKGTDRISCSSPSGESAPIGSVAVGAAGSSGAGSAGTAATTTGGTGTTTSTNRVQAAQDAESTESPVPGDASASADTAATDQALADQLRLLSMTGAANGNGGGSYISRATVGWGTLGIVLTSVLFTVLTNARTRRLEQAGEEY